MMARTPPDIFLSYSRQDLAIAGQMAAALQAAGHIVWWDQALKAGEVYDRVTETALREARVVVVLWSKAAVASDWVRSEATVALQRGALVPVMIEDCQRPVMFELRQSADLVGWKGNAKDARLLAFVADVTRQLATSAVGTPAKAVAMPATALRPSPNRRLLIGGAAGFAALVAGGYGAWRYMGGEKADDGTASIAVLPFADLSGDPAQAYFADGLAEELRGALSQIPALKVIGRTSSEKFRDAADLSVVAAQLGVTNVLTGSVRRSPTMLRIAVQLIDGKTGVESWSRTVERPVGDALAIQSSIATGVVGALSQRLGKTTGTVTVGGTTNSEAQMLVLKADNNRDNETSEAQARQTVSLLDAAIAIDPNYALAYSLKSIAMGNLRAFERDAASERATRAEAAATALRAVQLQPTSGRIQTIYANGLLFDLQIRAAVAGAKRAVALEPGNVYALGGASRTLAGVDPGLALDLANRVIGRDPFNARAFQGRAEALYNLGRYAEANVAGVRASDLSNGTRAGGVIIRSLILLNRFAEARRAIDQQPILRLALPNTALLELRAGNGTSAAAAMAALDKFDPDLTAYDRARIHAQRGDTAKALDALEEALAAKNPSLQYIAFDHFLDPVRRETRFQAIQDKIIPPDLIVRPARGPA